MQPSKATMRKLIALAASAAAHAVASSAAQAQAYPTHPVRLLIHFPPGGSTDIVGRVIAPPLGQRLGQPVVVENRPGAGGAIAAEIAAHAPADGHTLLIAGTSSVLGLNEIMFPNLPYKISELTSITRLVTSPFIVAVNTQMMPGVNSIKDLIAAVKAKPHQPFGSGGTGSGMHLAGEYFRSLAGLDMFHVPYKGNGPAMQDLAGGQIPIVFVDLGSTGAYAKNEKVKVLAIAQKTRTEMAPNMPTAAESGLPGWEALGSFGLVTASGTPRPVIMRLNKEVSEILNLPDIRTRILQTNNEPAPTSPEEYDAFIKSEVAKWTKVVKDANIKFD
jgi:tripartite-type tricarboxylate transporter receptor subunit TctC